VVNILQYFWEN